MNINNVAIYVRVSTLEQAESGYSIEEQTDKLKKYCDLKDWNIHKIYTDPGFSGSSIKRPALSQLITDAKLKRFDCVLIYKLDRLSRSQKDTLYLIEDVFTANDIAFVSLSENFDTATPFGKAMIGILAVFAQLEREQIKERMTMGKLGRAKAGKAMGWSKVPFGYKYDKDTGIYTINELEASIIKRIFNDYLSGISITKLKDHLNEEGHVGKDIDWSYRTIRQTLDNKTYCGYTKYKGQYFKADYPAIIDEETYEKTIKELDIRQKQAYEMNNNPRPFQTKYMMSGLIRCGICGATFDINLGSIRKDGTRSKKYRCHSTKSKKHNPTMKKNPNGCTSNAYNMEDLEHVVLDVIEQLRINPLGINELSNTEEETAPEIIKNRINELDKTLEKLIDLFLDSSLPKSKLQARQTKILEEKEALENQLIDRNKRLLEPSEAIDLLADLNKSVFEMTYEEQKILVRKLIEKIVIYPENIDITWKFAVLK